MIERRPSTVFNNNLSRPLCAVALQDLDSKSFELSASGGAFAVFARTVIAQGGVVFGASLCDGGKVRHICVDSIKSLPLLQGSKYVQSDVADTYDQCARLLSNGIKVLYSGTPCQIASLRRYLTKRVDQGEIARNLLCVDLICHGTPKSELFIAYMEWLALKMKADNGIHGFEFRSKKMGWGLYYYYYYYRGGKKHEVLGPARDDPYYAAFTNGTFYRKCCYKCPFARIERTGDITVGDYWGIDEVHPGFSDKRGVSAVLFNTQKGKRFFIDNCADECRFVYTDVDDVAAYNANLVAPASRSEDAEKLAGQVELAIGKGDYDRAFGVLLAPKLSAQAKVRKALPWRLVRLLSRFRR